MNAKELADKLEKPMLDNPNCPNFSRTRAFMEKVISMLRYQENQIDVLKTQLAYLESKVYGGSTK